MAETVIGSTIAGTVSDPTGMAWQNHLVWATNDAAWWLFYLGSSSTTTIQTYRSPDGTTWTSKTASGAPSNTDVGGTPTFNSQGRNLGCFYKNISSNDVVHLSALIVNGTNQEQWQHNRASISSGAVTWSGWAGVGSSNRAYDSATFPGGCAPVIDSNQRPVDFINADNSIDGNAGAKRATNTDAGSSWTAGFGAATQIEAVTNSVNAGLLIDVGSQVLLGLWENASGTEPSSMTNVRAARYSASWGTVANVFTAFTAEDPNNFGVCKVDNTHTHIVAKTGTNTYVHKIVDGTTNAPTVSAGASITNQNSLAAGGLAMALGQDGNVYLAIIDTDAANTVRYCKYNGSTWSSWSALETSTKTRKFLTASQNYDSSGNVLFCWTETNGSNFDVAVAPLSTSSSTFVGDDEGLTYQVITRW